MPPKFVAFDLETTGLNNQKDEIIEIGAVKFTVETKNGKVVPKLLGELETFVKPNMMIPAEASAVNHIYDSDVQDAPAVGDAIKKFTEFCGQSSILLAHNANFDASFLRVAYKNNPQLVPGNPVTEILSPFLKTKSPPGIWTLSSRSTQQISTFCPNLVLNLLSGTSISLLFSSIRKVTISISQSGKDSTRIAAGNCRTRDISSAATKSG